MKMFCLFSENKLDLFMIPASYKSKMPALRNMKDKINTKMPQLISQISAKYDAVQKPVKKPTAMMSSYMRDYQDYTKKDTAPVTFEKLIALFDNVTISEKKQTIIGKSEEIKKHENLLPPLMQVLYPIDLIMMFIKKAEKNTRNSIETCGILCGIKKEAAYFITRIFMPEQKGTIDQVITLNYEGIQNYVTKNNLIVLGWIHTHPDYTCFLSSVDVHTQYGYQKLLPESIAIVYSGLRLEDSEKYFFKIINKTQGIRYLE